MKREDLFFLLLRSICLIFIIVVLLSVLNGCNTYIEHIPEPERPVVNVPLGLRQQNWLKNRQGSCTWANIISILRWQGHYEKANWIRQNYGSGEHPESFANGLEEAGIRYASITNGDVKFLEWACNTRRGCGITVRGGKHMVTLVHLDSEWAAILDNNQIDQFIWIPRESLIAEWHASYGWAVTPIYTPCPPMP